MFIKMVTTETNQTFMKEIIYKQKEMMMKQNAEFFKYISKLVD